MFDYYNVEKDEVNVRVVAMYNYPDILETHALCVARTSKTFNQLVESNKETGMYSNIRGFQNSEEGVLELVRFAYSYIPFYPPSRTILEYFYVNYERVNAVLTRVPLPN